LREAASETALLEEAAEVLNNRNKTPLAVKLLEEARTFEGLPAPAFLSVSVSLGKQLSHLGRHDDAIHVITEALTKYKAAAPETDRHSSTPIDLSEAIWVIDGSLIDDKCDDFGLIVLRALYQLANCFRRKEQFLRAQRQIEKVLDLEQELARHGKSGKSLLRMAKHQKCRILEDWRLCQHRCRDVFDLVDRGIPPAETDLEEVDLLQSLISEAACEKPDDLQRLAFFHLRLGLHKFFLRDGEAAVSNLDKAISFFGKAGDRRNLDPATNMRHRVSRYTDEFPPACGL
jgi:tetratricopeptide (TPR) repeat protein